MNSGHDVAHQMLAVGLDMPPLPLDLSGKVRRFGPKKNHWYRLREMRTDGGQFVVVGSFGNWKGQERFKVDVDWKGIGAEERAQLQQQREAAAARDRAARAELGRLASLGAAELWRQASALPAAGRNAYLERKGVEAEACRHLPDGSLVIPLLRYDLPRELALKGLQRIWPDGSKRFTRGLEKTAACLRLGQVVVGEPVLVCEGYATGLSLRMAVDRRLPVFVALDAGNLLPVCELLRPMFEQSLILICADDDWHTEGNPGRDKAHKASRSVANANCVWPIFHPGRRRAKDTDYNDLHRAEGLNALARQLGSALRQVGTEWPAVSAAAA